MSLIQNLEKLRYFHKLKDHSSINEASKALGISQGGLSKSIQTLESILELKLLIREKNGFRFTPEGEMLVKSSSEILEIVQKLQTDLSLEKKIAPPRKLTIGIYDSFAVYFYPELLQYAKAVYPRLTIQLVVDRSNVVLDYLEQGKVDLVMGSEFRKIPESLQSFKLLHDHFSLYIKASLVEKHDGMPLLCSEVPGFNSPSKIDPSLAHLLKTKLAHQVTNFETIKQMASQGLGIAVLPTLVAKPFVENRSLVAINIPGHKAIFSKHDVELITNKKFYASHKKFVDEIIKFAANWSAV